MKASRGSARRQHGFVTSFATGLRDLELARTASALSFTTLLALVPLASVTFAAVSRFPIFSTWLDALEKFLLRHMVPGSAEALVHTYVLGFAERAAQLRGLSLAFIALTAVLLLAMIEREINVIFGVKKGRTLARRVPIYLAGLTVGPILIGASIWLSTRLMAESSGLIPREASIGEIIIAPLPLALTAVAFASMYKLVPARPVRGWAAAVGGVAGAIAFEVMKHGFAWYLQHVPTYEFVYGALAALPVFLVWLHLCWMIVLAGAVLTAALDGTGMG